MTLINFGFSGYEINILYIYIRRHTQYYVNKKVTLNTSNAQISSFIFYSILNAYS